MTNLNNKLTQTNQKESTMEYEMYETRLDSDLKKEIEGKLLKQVFGEGPIAYSDYVDLRAMDMLHDSTELDNVIQKLTVLGLEKRWLESSSPVMFLKNRELAQTLFEAEIDVSGAIDLKLPCKQFAIAFPADTLVNGYEIKSCLVSIMTYRKLVEALHYIGDEEDFCNDKRELDAICFVVNFSTSDGFEVMTLRNLSDLDDFSFVTGESADVADTMLKMAFTLCLHNLATEGEMVQGSPDLAEKLPGSRLLWLREVDINNSMNTLLD